MKKKIFYIISTSVLLIIIFLNGETIIFTEINKDGDGLILTAGKDQDLDTLTKFLVGNNIEKFVGIIDSTYFIPTIILLLIIIIGIDTFFKRFLVSTIAIRGPPAQNFFKYIIANEEFAIFK